MKKEISQELYDAMIEQSLLSAKISSIIEKEEVKDFWVELDKEIDKSLYAIKYNVGFWSGYHVHRLDLKWLDMFRIVKKQRLIEDWERYPFQACYWNAVLIPLEQIMIAQKECVDRRCDDMGRLFNREMGKL